tara:strand:+ start:4414 stop:8082 length:3669 start_codon:yes stop_codon:yes gene_type:complete
MALDTNPTSTGILLSSDTKGSPIPTVLFSTITLDEAITNPNYIGEFQNSNLVINLTMNIEIPLDALDDDVLNNLSICISRCDDPMVANRIQITGDIPKESLKKVYKGPLKSLLKGQDLDVVSAQEESIYETSGGKKIFNLSFQKMDKLQTAKSVPHLSYYAFCYLDLENLADSLGIQDIPNLGPTIGPLSGEVVIQNGKVNTTSYVYFVTSPYPENLSGTYWTGPVMQSESGQWMAAKWTLSQTPKLKTTSPHIDLERIEVRNTKIQDHRFIKQIPSFNFDLIPSNFMPATIKGNDNFDNSIQNPDAYISNAFLTRDMHNNCRFLFEFDFHRALIKESKFGKILTNPFVPENTKRKIYNYSPITNLKIMRRQVETVKSFNRLSSPILGINMSDVNHEPKLIVETSSNPDMGNTLKKNVMFAPGTGDGDLQNKVGSIMEIKSIHGSPKQTRTIAVTDNSVSQIQNGTYQYGVKIEMEDGSIRFLNERLKRLRTLRTYLKEYYDLKQIPEKSYQTVSGIMEYYDVIFSTNLQVQTPTTLGIGDFNRSSFSIKSEINNLRSELGFLIGNLNPRETLYPWVIVPEYLVDTLETISDFSYVTKSKRIDQTQIIQTPSARLQNDSGLSLQSFNRAGTSRGTDTASATFAKDEFDEKTARFSLKTLLDPRSATSESILQVIGVMDMLTQKIRTMMGSSAQIEELSLSTKRRGVAKNSKVSVLNLEDYFIELFDARLSSMPAVDYIGFRNSMGFISPVGQGEFGTVVQGGTAVNALESGAAINAGDAGVQAMASEDYAAKVQDEDDLDDVIDQEEINRLEEQARAAEAGEQATEDAAEQERLRREAEEAKRQKEELEKQREQDPADTSGSSSTGNNWRRRQYEDERRNSTSQDLDAPVDAPETDKPKKKLLVTPTVYDDRKGNTLLVTSKTVPKDEEFTALQNETISANSGNDFAAGNQNSVNTMMNNINVQVEYSKTPLAAQDMLTTSQAYTNSSVAVEQILGRTDRQFAGSTDAQINTCTDGLDGGDGSVDAQRCRDQTNAQGMFQAIMNVFAENGAFNQIYERAKGDPSMLKNIYTKYKKKNETARDRSINGSAKERLTYGRMAEVTVFMGYEKDSDGNFMIKRPIFKTPSNWDQLIRHLQSPGNSNDIILCRIELNPFAPKGLEMVEANAYFLITKDKNTMVRQSSTRNGRPPQAKREKIEKIMREKDIPPEALRSLYIQKRGGNI